MENQFCFSHILKIYQPQSQTQIILDGALYSIGRHPENSIVIPSQFISRIHALLVRIDHPGKEKIAFRIIDGNQQGRRSINGIAINGKFYRSHILQNGDHIRLGSAVEATYEIVPIVSPKFMKYLNFTQVKPLDKNIQSNEFKQTFTDIHFSQLITDEINSSNHTLHNPESKNINHQTLMHLGSLFEDC